MSFHASAGATATASAQKPESIATIRRHIPSPSMRWWSATARSPMVYDVGAPDETAVQTDGSDPPPLMYRWRPEEPDDDHRQHVAEDRRRRDRRAGARA